MFFASTREQHSPFSPAVPFKRLPAGENRLLFPSNLCSSREKRTVMGAFRLLPAPSPEVSRFPRFAFRSSGSETREENSKMSFFRQRNTQPIAYFTVRCTMDRKSCQRPCSACSVLD